MRSLSVIVLHLCASLLAFFESGQISHQKQQTTDSWPTQFQGEPLIRLEMTEQERGFSQHFPGKIARFTDGGREIIIRHIDRPSRMVHSSADCLKGSGYKVSPQPISRDQNDQLWGCVLAERNGISYRVCERIYDQSGNSWYDVSSWFWSAVFNNNQGPWSAITVAEQV